MKSARLTAALLCLVAAGSLWRAATLAVTTDEASTYSTFVRNPLDWTFRHYDANNHVLHTFACRAVLAVLPVHELSLRLPALLGGWLYLWVVWRLARRLSGGNWAMPVLAGWLALHPLLLDFMVCARGYSLALAFLFWAVLLALDGRPCGRLALLLAAAAGANLTFLVPAAALAAVVSFAHWRERRSWAALAEAAERLWTPWIAGLFLVLALPLTSATRANFYFGAPSPAAGVVSIVSVHAWPQLDALLCAAFTGALALAAARFPLGAVTALSGAALVAAHACCGTPYPAGRTGIYWIPLLVLAAYASAAHWLRPWPRVRAALACLLLAPPGFFAAGSPLTYFRDWREDNANRRIMQQIAQRLPPGGQAEIAAEFPLYEGLGFYRDVFHLGPGVQVRRASDGVTSPAFYVTHQAYDDFYHPPAGWRRVFYDATSEASLWIPGPTPAAP